MTHTTLRQGIMVTLTTHVKGGVSRSTPIDLPVDETMAPNENAKVIRRETTTIIEDPAEREAASKLRSKLSGMIRKQCIKTEFCLLCPEANAEALKAAVAQAQALAAEYNKVAKKTKIFLYVMTGQMSTDDEQNARAITSEVRTLIATIEDAIEKLEPKAIQEAASKAARVSAMLAPEQSAKIGAAVAAARKAARDINRLSKKGTEAAEILADIQRGAIVSARNMFASLDFEDAPVNTGDELPAVDVARVAGIDLGDDEDASEPVAATGHANATELDLTGESSERVETAAAEPTAFIWGAES